ncbi:hypothetical protein RvY_00613 [Ramazzottius varieornatus]|uniref:WW domain-containing protein n=1 Tax=Ramazzottius varieornatus TaxID=947166 RepID=A0A1D1UDU8_RAMVA|nr:hypothetical protein RvY_00613 [Ramazzottius varieornatus]
MGDDGGKVITRQESPSSIIHIRTDSDGILQDMFKQVGQRSSMSKNSTPLKERKLPAGFFEPPKQQLQQPSPSHTPQPLQSKELPNHLGSPLGNSTSGCFHVRSRSSPASISQSLSLAPDNHAQVDATGGNYPPVASKPSQQPPQSHHKTSSSSSHFRQKSMPAAQQLSSMAASSPQLLNIHDVTEQFRLVVLSDGRMSFQNRYSMDIYPDTPVVRTKILGPLPNGWAASEPQPGSDDVYYIDHLNRTTTWFDPRLPKPIQEPLVLARHQQQQQQQQAQQQQLQSHNSHQLQQSSQNALQHLQQQQTSQPSSTVFPGSSSSILSQLQPQLAPNFSAGSTTSFFERNSGRTLQPATLNGLVPHLATSQQQQLKQQNVNNPLSQQSLQSQQLLQALSMERDSMRLRQKELQQQQQQIFRQQPGFADQSVSASLYRDPVGDYDMLGSPMSPLASVRLSDALHGRQESKDSGYGHSASRTPENFLAQTMDELSLTYHADIWDGNSNMDMTVGSDNNFVVDQQVDQIMTDSSLDDGLLSSDMILSDIESVLRNDNIDNASNITWL